MQASASAAEQELANITAVLHEVNTLLPLRRRRELGKLSACGCAWMLLGRLWLVAGGRAHALHISSYAWLLNDWSHRAETILEDYKKQPGVWRHCEFFLSQSTDNYLLHYAGKILEYTVRWRWSTLQRAEQKAVLEFLFGFLTSYFHVSCIEGSAG